MLDAHPQMSAERIRFPAFSSLSRPPVFLGLWLLSLPSNTVAPCLPICLLPPFYKDPCDDSKPLGHLSISRSLTQSHLQSPFYHVNCTSMASGGQDVVNWGRLFRLPHGSMGGCERWKEQSEKLMSALFSSPFSNTRWLPLQENA